MMTVKLMQGNEAVVDAAIKAGLNFFAGYPITPSTEIAELCSEKLPLIGGKFIQMEDELSSMAAVIGASLAGAKAMTATSGPGFSLKQENIGFASMAEIPCVIVDVQRCGPSTGMPTMPSQGDVMQSRWGTHGDHPIIVMSPSSVKEAYEITIKAFNLTYKYRTPVILLLDEVIGHVRERIEIEDDPNVTNEKFNLPDVNEYIPYKNVLNGVSPFIPFGLGYKYHVTGLAHDEKGYPTNSTDVNERLMRRLLGKIENNRDDICVYDEKIRKDSDVLIVSYGSSARACKESMKMLGEAGINASFFKPITIWPFPEAHFKEISEKFKYIFVVEMNNGQLYLEIDRLVKGFGKVIKVNKFNGEYLTPQYIYEKVKESL
ncbi:MULTISPECIES: 2-oxoacid:acceptor oxidoreductase subunit alpha [unclassified Thermoanaerobacterium]|uniref:2-oxoacid:acceptor oxidoreductase subunit alpha n=1 Tax=unclassified Thermoanaerobacterium TaxID=2622527 RepID=UPI000A1658F9|nr:MULTISPECIES: 2-oxoacid:acceptor oxidoreductase subunit alpha [unclassified Thermoanaerobacterium]MDE4541483.1 2-oxoacid:acceptor oxidoreductase subunit alpha [Thermoanaerobacterium sp. R66]ORX23524.1 2-oxoglutarate synthase subunit alpha [Thermoanaerobacterium sp. PSU-2]